MRAARLQWLIAFLFLTASTFGPLPLFRPFSWEDWCELLPETKAHFMVGFAAANLCVLLSTMLPGWWLRRRRLPVVRRWVNLEVGYRASGRRIEVVPNTDSIQTAQVYVCTMQTTVGLAVCIGISLIGFHQISTSFHVRQNPIEWWAFLVLGWIGCLMHWPRVQRPADARVLR